MKYGSLLLLLLAPLAISAAPPELVSQVAREQGVPSDVLWAVVSAESQSVTQEGAKPWPWVLNVHGEPLFFQTRAAASNYAYGLLARGDRNWDVGLGQINFKWHGHRVNGNPSLLLEPRINLSIAAQILREQYDRPACKGWVGAIGCFHRPARSPRDIEIANNYTARVLEHWALQTKD